MYGLKTDISSSIVWGIIQKLSILQSRISPTPLTGFQGHKSFRHQALLALLLTSYGDIRILSKLQWPY